VPHRTTTFLTGEFTDIYLNQVFN